MHGCTHLSRFSLLQGFPGEIRKKVHMLLYHSLCTNVGKALWFDRITRRGIHLPFRGATGVKGVQIPEGFKGNDWAVPTYWDLTFIRSGEIFSTIEPIKQFQQTVLSVCCHPYIEFMLRIQITETPVTLLPM